MRKQTDEALETATTSAVNTTTSNDFPESAEWSSLTTAKDKLTDFNMQNIVSYFIERKAKDDESNKDYKNVSSKAFGLFRHGHVQKIELASDTDRTHIRCECLPEMKKTFTYKLKLSLSSSGDIVYASCPCPAGKGPLGSCKHVAALCYALEELKRLKSSREFQTCTSRLQEWNQPRKRKLEPQSVYFIDFSKKIYGKEERNKTKPLTDPRHPIHRNADSTDANKDLLEKINKVIPNCVFFYLLSNEKQVKSADADIISPVKEQPVSLETIINRAEKIKENLKVTYEEIQRIAAETKTQSKCKTWFLERRVRITASKCKRAILKPTTSPTKAMREILDCNPKFQSVMMKQGLEDEKKILRSYEKKVGCKVKESGFIICQSHPFLGASPDGEVDGGLLEVKRIFSKELSLKEAIYKRGICIKNSDVLTINKRHKFYYQVQLQMLCTGCLWTDLVLSDMQELVIIHIKKSKHFLSGIVPKLEEFYEHIALELAYPRVVHGLPRLGKLISRDD